MTRPALGLKTLAGIIVLVAVLAVLVACQQATPTPTPTATPQPTATPTPRPTPTPTPPPSGVTPTVTATPTPAPTPTPSPIPTPAPRLTPTPAPQPTPTPTPSSAAQVREIKITARYAQFEPASITVKKGELVKLVITSVDVFHTFTSDELKLDIALNPGQTVEREFTAPSTGTFTFYCQPHRDSGMTGTLRVEEASGESASY